MAKSEDGRGLQGPVFLMSSNLCILLRLASLGGGPQAHVHVEGMKCRVFYLNVLGMNAPFCEPKATPAPYL